jgi:hypothetical protein
MSIKKGQCTFEWKLGGAESGAPSWDASWSTLTCNVLRYQDNNKSVTVDDTLPCDGLVQDVGVRGDRTIDIDVIVPDAKMIFGTAVNQHIQFRATFPTTGTSTVETMVGAIRTNNRGANMDDRIIQNISIRIKSVTSITGPA